MPASFAAGELKANAYGNGFRAILLRTAWCSGAILLRRNICLVAEITGSAMLAFGTGPVPERMGSWPAVGCYLSSGCLALWYSAGVKNAGLRK